MGPRVEPSISRAAALVSGRTPATWLGELTQIRLPLLPSTAGIREVAIIPGISMPILMSGLLDIEVIFMFLNVASPPP